MAIESSRYTQFLTSQSNFVAMKSGSSSGTAAPAAAPTDDISTQLLSGLTTDGLLGIEPPAEDAAAGASTDGSAPSGAASATSDLNADASLG